MEIYQGLHLPTNRSKTEIPGTLVPLETKTRGESDERRIQVHEGEELPGAVWPSASKQIIYEERISRDNKRRRGEQEKGIRIEKSDTRLVDDIKLKMVED